MPLDLAERDVERDGGVGVLCEGKQCDEESEEPYDIVVGGSSSSNDDRPAGASSSSSDGSDLGAPLRDGNQNPARAAEMNQWLSEIFGEENRVDE